MKAEVVAQLLPADHVAQSRQVSDPLRVQLSVFHDGFVEDQVGVRRQLKKAGLESVRFVILLRDVDHLVEVFDGQLKIFGLAQE